MSVDHLAMAKEDLAIAESGDAKREAYKRAADHIAAAKDAGATNVVVATTIGKSEGEVRRLLRWRGTGFKAETPYLMDEGATERAALSHAKKIIREEPKKIAAAIEQADPEQRQAIIDALAKSDKTHEQVNAASWNATVERQKRGKVDMPKPVKRQGALSTWVDVTGWARQAEDRGKRALEAVKSADEPIPEDLRDDLLGSVDVATAAWELVAATLRGESVGDQAEAFLAEHDNNE